jgi:CheY-like chemotaxis protein
VCLYLYILQLLVASQNEEMLNLLDAYLNSEGLNHTLAPSGTRCLDEVERTTKDFDVIILDIGLYDINGLEVAKSILQLNPDQKIIVTTANSSEDLKRQALSIGIETENILLKPFKLTTLLSTVREAVYGTSIVGLKDHILASYNSVTEEITELIRFFKNGIKNNECVMFVTGKDTNIDLIKETFIINGIEVDRLLSDSSLIFKENRDWYIPDGKVDKDSIKNQWIDLVKTCVTKGKKGLRAFCIMDTFFEHNLIEELVDYESTLSPKCDFQFVPVCAYLRSDLEKLSKKQKERLIRSHSHVWM